MRWSGQGFLSQVSGPSIEASPVRALYLAHRVAASGRLWMSKGVEVCSITLSGGSIAGCSGFQNLVDGNEGERQWNISAWAESVREEESGEARSLIQVARSLCGAALRIEADGDWMVNFITTDEPPPEDATIPEDLAASLQAAIGDAVSDSDVRGWLAGATDSAVEVWRPDDSAEDRWGLNEEGLRLLKACEANGTVGSLYVEIGSGGWSSFATLWRLGLVSIAPTGESADIEMESPPPEPATQPTPAQAAPEESPPVPPPAADRLCPPPPLHQS